MTTISDRPLRRRMTDATLTRDIAPGVHRLTHAYVNCYLLEEQGALTVVDAAHPHTWSLLLRAIEVLGLRPRDVRAIVLTHAHFDHLGFARRAAEEWRVPVWAHPRERYIARHPYRYAHENPRLVYPIQHPAALPALLGMTLAGALRVKGVDDVREYAPGEVLEVPGHPRVVFSPGHTFGHCALHLESQSVLLTGDALVTFNPYTGETGPQIVSGAATADSAEALASLDALAATDARVVLPGHGGSWRSGIRSAVDLARRAGPSREPAP